MKHFKKVATYLALLGSIVQLPGGMTIAKPIDMDKNKDSEASVNDVTDDSIKEKPFTGPGGDIYIPLTTVTEQIGLNIEVDSPYIITTGIHAQTGEDIEVKVEIGTYHMYVNDIEEIISTPLILKDERPYIAESKFWQAFGYNVTMVHDQVVVTTLDNQAVIDAAQVNLIEQELTEMLISSEVHNELYSNEDIVQLVLGEVVMTRSTSVDTVVESVNAPNRELVNELLTKVLNELGITTNSSTQEFEQELVLSKSVTQEVSVYNSSRGPSSNQNYNPGSNSKPSWGIDNCTPSRPTTPNYGYTPSTPNYNYNRPSAAPNRPSGPNWGIDNSLPSFEVDSDYNKPNWGIDNSLPSFEVDSDWKPGTELPDFEVDSNNKPNWGIDNSLPSFEVDSDNNKPNWGIDNSLPSFEVDSDWKPGIDNELPNFEVETEVEGPEIEMPSIPNWPGFRPNEPETPEIQEPETPEIEIPEVQEPEIEVPSIPSRPTETETPETSTPSYINEFEMEVIELVNIERQKYNLSPLQIDESLCQVARVKSEDMQQNSYFSHTSPVYGSVTDLLKHFGVSYSLAGENIAKGQTTPEQVVNAWMNSEGHRANILKSEYTRIGVGYVSSGNHWTQIFAK
ncbi:MAG: hypothetical protein ATN33_07825 [Epulopiscium sp. Nele67-Bin001]|nr:MAG: hypothetical protein ATN33_07825 [Epulopiscium sp. Nele67-Bin001]